MTPEIDEFHAFIHDLRHYLRTAIIEGQRALGREQESDSVALKRSLESIVQAGLRCDELINAMVRYCDADVNSTGSLTVKRVLDVLPRELESILEPASARLSIDARLDGNLEIPLSVKDVWSELITNAVKFRREAPPEISLSIEADTEKLSFEVNDRGIGIPDEYLDRVFRPFRRLHTRNAYPGFGLGLARCRRIMRGLGGDLIAISSSSGARFKGWLGLVGR